MADRIRYLGHAGFIVQSAGKRLLIDPWFYPAFLGAWFPYPSNRHLLDQVTRGNFDYLYVSHAHEDHLDERVLNLLDRDTAVLVPRYRSKVMVRKFTSMGFRNLIVLHHKERHELAPGFTATMLLDTSHKEDSGLLLDLDGFKFLDLNDCNPRMSELPGEIDLLAAQYSGAQWYPGCYDYPPAVMAAKTAAVREGMTETLIRKARLTGARAYLPSAGPACFLDPALEHHNNRQETIFPLWPDVGGAFTAACPGTEVLTLAPGGELRGLTPGAVPQVISGDDQAWPSDPDSYLAAYRARRKDEWLAYYEQPADPVSSAEMEAYFRRLQRWNARFLHGYRKDIRLVTGSVSWSVRLGLLSEGAVLEDDPADPAYTLHVPPRVIRAVIDGRTGWEEALLSMRLTLKREPDVFDLTLMSLLRYGDHPAQTLQLVRERQSSETIDRDGLRMQRWCPHAGEDLTFATIRDGVIECPRHHWRWDAFTGECLEGGTVPLRVRALECGQVLR